MPIRRFTLVLAVAFSLPAQAAQETLVIERVVAVVDNAVVLQSELDAVLEQVNSAQPIPAGVDADAVKKQRRDQLLDTLIAEKLLEAEVRKLRIDVTDAEVERIVVSTMRENNLTEDTLKVALSRQGMTLPEYKEQLKKQLTKMKIVQLKVKSRVSVTDVDVDTARKQLERQQKTSGVTFTRVRARHILFLVPAGADPEEAKKKALAARAKVEKGADFADVASAESEDPGSKSRGGDLGAFGRGEMVAEFERAAFEAPLNKVVGPVRSPFGWHVIRVEEHLADEPGNPDEALGQLREQLYQKEVEVQFDQYLDELKRDAFIEKR